MLGKHEYSIVGHRRAQIAMYQAFIAGAIAGGVSVCIGFLATLFVDLEWIEPLNVILWPLTGGAVFAVLFAIFEKIIWRKKWLNWFVGVPDLAGVWQVEGQSFDEKEKPTYQWQAEITISQSYEKLSIHLKTESSSSQSVTAAILPEGDTGFRLIYSYRNAPRPGNAELNRHLGHCELLFNKKLTQAEGDYFNSSGRTTHGTMKLERL